MDTHVDFLENDGLLDVCPIDNGYEVGVRGALGSLSAENPFAFFDLARTDEEGKFLEEKLSIDTDLNAIIFMSLACGEGQDHERQIEDFLNKISDENKDIARKAVSIIMKEIANILAPEDRIELHMRASMSSGVIWHLDPSMADSVKSWRDVCDKMNADHSLELDCKKLDEQYYSYESLSKRISISLLGEKTIFATDYLDNRSDLIGSRRFDVNVLHTSPGANQGAVFLGSKENGAIHSKPSTEMPRLLMYVTLLTNLQEESALETIGLLHTLYDSLYYDERGEMGDNMQKKLCDSLNYCKHQ